MSTVVIPVGTPGSGKTTVLLDEARRRNATYICPDDIRLEITGNMEDQSQNFQVWNVTFQRVERALKDGHDIVVDATNTHGENRRFLTRFCCIYGGPSLQLELWWFGTPLEECISRNSKRNRVVPKDVLVRMAQQLIDDPLDMRREGYDVLVFT